MIMDTREVLKFCLEKGLLLDNDFLELLSETSDTESAKLVIERIRTQTGKKMITKNIFENNKDQANKFFLALPAENQKKLEKLKIKLGLSIEITQEVVSENSSDEIKEEIEKVKILTKNSSKDKKLEVKDFVNHFKSRFSEMRGFLQERAELNNLVSINKISGNKQGISVIGIVSDKKVTKNKNILLEIEDLTGRMRILINQNKPDLYEKAEDIVLDSVLGFKGSGNNEILFANDVIFPDSKLPDRKRSPVEEYAVFLGDLHFGSQKFLKSNFLKFIDYLNGKVPDTPESMKIKYLIIAGDLVTGIGNYPGQERELDIGDLEEQFLEVANIFSKIRRDIKIIISPGNHDCVRIMEPQPVFDEKYAWPLYNLKNVYITENPATVNIGAAPGFQGFDVLLYHGFSFPYYAGNVPKLMISKAMNAPETIMKFLLMNRHLAPAHMSTQYFPSEKDYHVISKVPDIFVSGHSHKSGVTYHNNILIVSASSWEGKTAYQEKLGSEPDHCKVPLLNLKTRAVKILDFE